MIIDAHAHLWKTQNGCVNGRPVYSVGSGRSSFGGEIRQMLPPYILDGSNTAEIFISNMNYAGVSGAVITQEYIDGRQDDYLREVKKAYPDKFKICSLYDESTVVETTGFDGIKICAGRLKERDLLKHTAVFEFADREKKFISIDLADGAAQTGALREIVESFPDLRIAIGHFGMVTRDNWLSQIELAAYKNVYIESGGITWLFNAEFYPYPSAVKAVNEAAKICGFEKLMWGSDYPRTMTAITYKMSFDFIEKASEISQEDKESFLGKNAAEFYGFGNLSVPEKTKNMLED